MKLDCCMDIKVELYRGYTFNTCTIHCVALFAAPGPTLQDVCLQCILLACHQSDRIIQSHLCCLPHLHAATRAKTGSRPICVSDIQLEGVTHVGMDARPQEILASVCWGAN